MSPVRTTLAPQHLYPLEGLSLAPSGLFPKMYLCAVDSAHNVSSDQWAASVPFNYLFDVLFGFL